MEKTIHFVRHGEVKARSGIYLGTTDVELNDRGREQSAWLADRLSSLPVDRCFCSPLLRAQQTALNLAGNKGVEIEMHDALREIDFGRWEGRSFAEIEGDDPQKAADWCSNPLDFSFPEGNSVVEFMERLQRYLLWLKNVEGNHLLLVTHGGVIRILLTLLLQLDPDRQFMFEVARGSLSTVKIIDTTAVLTGLNYGMG